MKPMCYIYYVILFFFFASSSIKTKNVLFIYFFRYLRSSGFAPPLFPSVAPVQCVQCQLPPQLTRSSKRRRRGKNRRRVEKREKEKRRKTRRKRRQTTDPVFVLLAPPLSKKTTTTTSNVCFVSFGFFKYLFCIFALIYRIFSCLHQLVLPEFYYSILVSRTNQRQQILNCVKNGDRQKFHSIPCFCSSKWRKSNRIQRETIKWPINFSFSEWMGQPCTYSTSCTTCSSCIA